MTQGRSTRKFQETSTVFQSHHFATRLAPHTRQSASESVNIKILYNEQGFRPQRLPYTSVHQPLPTTFLLFSSSFSYIFIIYAYYKSISTKVARWTNVKSPHHTPLLNPLPGETPLTTWCVGLHALFRYKPTHSTVFARILFLTEQM